MIETNPLNKKTKLLKKGFLEIVVLEKGIVE
jgi:hypothetical protein